LDKREEKFINEVATDFVGLLVGVRQEVGFIGAKVNGQLHGLSPMQCQIQSPSWRDL